MQIIRWVLSGVMIVQGIRVLGEMRFSNFNLGDESMHLTILAGLGLATWTIWDRHTTARFRKKSGVQSTRLLFTTILVIFIVVDVRQLGLKSFLSGIFSTDYVFVGLIFLMTLYLWIRSLDDLVLKG
jgi:hypothetical protein